MVQDGRMLENATIVVTGATGQVGLPVGTGPGMHADKAEIPTDRIAGDWRPQVRHPGLVQVKRKHLR